MLNIRGCRRLLFLLLCLFWVSGVAYGKVYYVSVNGSDAEGDGAYASPFQTIQFAINQTTDNDTVIVLEGRYTGQRNTNLNFYGKTITLQSEYPEDPECAAETIIDAQGEGCIVRFINDEGKAAGFMGFTLSAGDISQEIKGIPGFFEFSASANPTTKHLVLETDKYSDPYDIPSSQFGPGIPSGKRYWDGDDPFHQPAETTNYYGSGDADNDGEITRNDVSMAEDMAYGRITPSIRGDVDGDGDVDISDADMIEGALSGDILPGWWNRSASRAERNRWVDRMIELDRTDYHPYEYPWFVCHHFALQTSINAAALRVDLYTESQFDGGQTVYNLPMYYVEVDGENFLHAINAILVGDNPLSFYDWRFIEPESDDDVEPGMWDMPINSRITIKVANLPNWWDESLEVVVFEITEDGPHFKRSRGDLFLDRFDKSPSVADNRIDRWNPRIVDTTPPALLFDQMREDMSRTTDIHLAELTIPFSETGPGSPLTGFTQYSRLMDGFKSAGGNVHLLWKSQKNYAPGIFYGQLNADAGNVDRVQRLSAGSRIAEDGRVIVKNNGDIHVFWTENPGIFWMTGNGSYWTPDENLTPEMKKRYGYSSWEDRSFPHHFFDVDIFQNDVVLVYFEKTPSGYTPVLLRYGNGWDVSDIPGSPWNNGLCGLDICTDDEGVLHFAYWLGVNSASNTTGMGNLYHRTYDGSEWSDPVLMDENAAGPKLSRGLNGDVYMVWEKKVEDHVYPAWNHYQNGKWENPSNTIKIRSGADAWNPSGAVLSDGRYVLTWSSRSSDRVTIETAVMNQSVSVNPISHDFGSVLAGEASASCTFAVANHSETAIALSSVSISGSDSSDFSIVGGKTSGITIPPHSQYAVEIRFLPHSGGDKTGYFEVRTADNRVLKAPLAGAGLQTYFVEAIMDDAVRGKIVSDPEGLDCGDECQAFFTENTTVTLRAVPDENTVFTGWTGVDCIGIGDCVVSVTSDVFVSANFADQTYIISTTSGLGGSILPSGDIPVEYDADKIFAIVPDTGYQIKNVIVDGVSVGPLEGYRFTGIDSNHDIRAEFETATYTISAYPANHSSISPAGSVQIKHGGRQTFTISAESGYEIADVTVDGHSVGAISEYVFDHVTKNHTIQVSSVRSMITAEGAGAGGGGCFIDSVLE